MTMTNSMKLCRDRSPEAKAIGAWFVEIVQTTESIYGRTYRFEHHTDLHQTRSAAMIAGLSLAFALGVETDPRAYRLIES